MSSVADHGGSDAAVDPLDRPLNELRDGLVAAAQRHIKEKTMKAPESVINDMLHQQILRPELPEIEQFGRDAVAALAAEGYQLVATGHRDAKAAINDAIRQWAARHQLTPDQAVKLVTWDDEEGLSVNGPPHRWAKVLADA